MRILTVPKTANWLEDALEIDIYLGSIMPQSKAAVEILFRAVSTKLTNIRNKPRHKEALKLVILNLYVGWCLGKPIRYSRNKSNYRHHKRYALLHFKFDRILPLIDALTELGYVQQTIGNYDNKREFGRQSRMWATPKLIMLFQSNDFDHPDVIQKMHPVETIQLKDDSKRLIDYREEPFITEMRNNLTEYNDFISQQKINVEIPLDGEISLNRLTKILNQEKTGIIEIKQVIQNTYLNNNKYIEVSSDKYDTENIYTMTNPIRSSYNTASEHHECDYHNIPECYREEYRYNHVNKCLYLPDYYGRDNTIFLYNIQRSSDRDELKVKAPLSKYGIQSFSFTVKYNALHRVFNRGSFSLGGRFWGAYHLTMPKGLRRHILINGKPTVELDYSALHIRMLYHLENIDYTDDPYMTFCASDGERIIHKLAILAAINAQDENLTLMGIRNKFREDGIPYDLTNKSLQHLIDDFRTAHKPIAHYLCSSIGRELQNKDSFIAEAILTRLTRDGIPCLPVHDSFIVEVQHKDTLYQVMIEEYEKKMGFQPQIGKEVSAGT